MRFIQKLGAHHLLLLELETFNNLWVEHRQLQGVEAAVDKHRGLQSGLDFVVFHQFALFPFGLAFFLRHWIKVIAALLQSLLQLQNVNLAHFKQGDGVYYWL
jgi:hypothetical protein